MAPSYKYLEERRVLRRATGKVEGLRCAEDDCKGVLQLRWSAKFNRLFYGCSRYPLCDGTLPARDDGSPKGEPRKKSLQAARNAAHEAFDVIWKNDHCSRTNAYRWLSHVMLLPTEQTHMFLMSEEQCAMVAVRVRQKGPGTQFWEEWISSYGRKKEGEV